MRPHTAPVRLLVVTPMWPSPAAPSYGVFVARQVAALRASGHDVRVISLESRRRGVSGAAKYLRLGREARRAAAGGADAVVGHMLWPAGAAAARAARRCRVPLVLVAHGQDVTNAERSRILRSRTRATLAAASALVCVSQDLADRLAAVYGQLPPMAVFDMGVDQTVFHAGPQDVAAAALGRSPQRPLVVQVGSLIERKNPERLTEAVARVRARHGSGELWLAGDGPLADRLAGRDGVVLLGQVSPEEAGRVLRAADVATLVALREGYGLAGLEAAACGVPLVVSDAIPLAADLPSTIAVRADPSSAAAIAAAIERALTLPRDHPDGQVVADAHSVARQAERLVGLIESIG